MKKILFVIDSLNCGGAEKSLVSLSSLLNKDKYDISLWMLYPGGAFLSLVPDYISIVSQPKYNTIEKIKYYIGRILFFIMIRLNKVFHKKKHGAETLWKNMGWTMKVPQGEWDIAFAYQQGVPTYLVAEKIIAKKKFAWVNADIFKAGYNIKFNSKFYRKFDTIVPVSSILEKLMIDKMPEFSNKYQVVYDVLNPNVIHELSIELVQNLRTSKDEWIIVTTGRLVPPKGYDIAVKAASLLKRSGLNFKWYIIGDGPERINIEKWKQEMDVDNEVILLGEQKNPYAFMSQSDIYVQTSKFEGFGMTIGEAKILGKPIVSTNFDVVHNQLTHEKNGLIADMTGESVAENILRLIEDSDLRSFIISAVKAEENITYISEVVKVEQLIDSNYEN